MVRKHIEFIVNQFISMTLTQEEYEYVMKNLEVRVRDHGAPQRAKSTETLDEMELRHEQERKDYTAVIHRVDEEPVVPAGAPSLEQKQDE